MKIELTCPDCHSTIRVDASHAGKQVRCPVCSCISQVPVEGEVAGASSIKSPVRDSAFERPPVSGLPPRIGTGNRKRIDNRSFLGLMWGIGAILSNFVCCGPIVGCVLALVGLGNGLVSKSTFKQSAIMINLIALAISVALLVMKFFKFG